MYEEMNVEYKIIIFKSGKLLVLSLPNELVVWEVSS